MGNEKVVPNCADFFAIIFFLFLNIVLLKKERENAGVVCLYDVHLTASRNETQLQVCQITQNSETTKAKLWGKKFYVAFKFNL